MILMDPMLAVRIDAVSLSSGGACLRNFVETDSRSFGGERGTEVAHDEVAGRSPSDRCNTNPESKEIPWIVSMSAS